MNPVSVIKPQDGEIDCTPSYLFDYNSLYNTDAREAGRQWFRMATFGLGIHFGLYSLLGKGEKALERGVLSPDDYKRLATKLEAPHFDAVDIVEFAIANGMRYINFCVKAEDGFSMFNTQASDYNCTRTPARRDFLGELASVCEYHGIGLCLNYSHGRDWSRPEGEPGKSHDPEMGTLLDYQEFMLRQLEELLTQYGPIAAITFNGIDVPLASKAVKEYGCQDLYDFVHHLQPQVLLAYSQGLLGTEDFFTCPDATLPSDDAPDEVKGYILKQTEKVVELRLSLTPDAWGYNAEQAGKHLKEEQIWNALTHARRSQCNLLANTALMPDGSLDFEDIQTLLAVGQKIEKSGYPG